MKKINIGCRILPLKNYIHTSYVTMTDEQIWNKKHNISSPSSVSVGQPDPNGKAKDLFTDNDPACTIKGCGFKNKHIAIDTIRLSGQPGSRYKQYWTIRAMYERAKRHPAQTEGMRDAIEIFDSWLHNHKTMKESKIDADEIAKEKEQRTRLVNSFANIHARSKCSSVEEFNNFARTDRNNALKCLREGAKQAIEKDFKLPITSFVSMFGGPGDHGYGKHLCDKAQQEEKSSFYCDCCPCFYGKHKILCDNTDIFSLGTRFPYQTFVLSYDGKLETAKYEKVVPISEKSSQTTIQAFFQPKSKRNYVHSENDTNTLIDKRTKK